MVTVGTVIVLALYALLDTIISLLFSGAMWIAKSIMDSSITLFTANQNIITTFVNLLPFSGGADGVTVNVGSIIDGISYGIITLVIIIGIIKSIASPLTGDDKADNPLNICVRAVIAIVAKHLIFGFGTNFLSWSFNGLLGVFGRWFGLILSNVGTFNYEKFTDINAWTLNAAAYIGALILMATLLGGVLGAAISYIERILSFALTILVGPIAISLYAYKETSHIARQWILSIFTQFGAILLNLLLWGAFINQINSLEGLWISSDDVGTLIFKLAVAVALLSLIKNCEKIFNSLGLYTLANQDAARSITGGIAALGSGAIMAMRMAPSAKAAVERGMHGQNPAQGGRGGMGFAGGRNPMPFTGNNLYDKSGNLNSKGEGNSFSNAARGVMARSAGNYNSPIMGSGSTRAAQNRQLGAQGALSNAVGSAITSAKESGRLDSNGAVRSAAGIRIGSAQVSESAGTNRQIAQGVKTDAPMYSGAQLANMAISGHENGYSSGFRFSPSGASPMGSAISDGVLNSSGYGEFQGAFKDAGGNAVTGSMVVGTTEAPSGAAVTGVIGQGIYMGSDGLEKNLGACFMPTIGGGEDNLLGVGQEVCVGYDKDGNAQNMYITDAIQIGDDGAYAYRLGTPSAPAEVVIANDSPLDVSVNDTRPVNVEITNTDPIDVALNGMGDLFDDKPASQDIISDFGESNINETDIFDPEDGLFSSEDE